MSQADDLVAGSEPLADGVAFEPLPVLRVAGCEERCLDRALVARPGSSRKTRPDPQVVHTERHPVGDVGPSDLAAEPLRERLRRPRIMGSRLVRHPGLLPARRSLSQVKTQVAAAPVQSEVEGTRFARIRFAGIVDGGALCPFIWKEDRLWRDRSVLPNDGIMAIC